MNSRQTANLDSANVKPAQRLPVKMLTLTFVVVAGLLLTHWQLDFLNERFNLNPGIPNVLTIVLSALTIGAWAIWAFFFAKKRLLGLLILLVPTVFLTLYYPNFGGDASINGWKPRFWKSEIEYTKVANPLAAGIDLATTSSNDFPQFLGPKRNGRVSGIRLASSWDDSLPKLLWKQPIGEGWSGFAAVNGFAVTQEQRDAVECVSCYRIDTGELMWIRKVDRRYEDIAAMGKVGPRSTPTIDEGRVYVMGGTGVLDCLNGSNGELIWSADVPHLVGIKQIPYTNGLGLKYTMEDSHLMWGRAGSPLIYKDQVIVAAGGPSEDPDHQTATLIAFDKISGSETWRGGKRMIAYGSPSLETVLGQPQILLVAENQAVGHDAETGEELWSHERSGNSNGDANCSQVTFVSDSQLLLSKGYNMGGELVELERKADAISVRSLHKDPRVLKTKLTSPVVSNGYAYSLSDGYLECTELKSLRRSWKQRGRFGNGQLLLVGDRLLVHTEDGELLLIAADPDSYQELGSINTIQGTCWNTICLYGNKLLVRSELEAACFELSVRASDEIENESSQ